MSIFFIGIIAAKARCGSSPPAAIGIGEHTRGDLPGEVPAVLAPAALTLLSQEPVHGGAATSEQTVRPRTRTARTTYPTHKPQCCAGGTRECCRILAYGVRGRMMLKMYNGAPPTSAMPE